MAEASLGRIASRAQMEAGESRTDMLERVISILLRCGVSASLVLVGAGVLLMALRGDTGYGPLPSPQALTTPGPVAWPSTLGAVLAGALAGRPYALVLAGLLLLTATPVLRVGISVVAFLIERDYAFALITLFVLGVLVLSFALGAAEGRT